jgi:hypothetical protein
MPICLGAGEVRPGKRQPMLPRLPVIFAQAKSALFFTQAVTLPTGLQQFVGLATTDAGFGGDNAYGDNQHIVSGEKIDITFL